LDWCKARALAYVDEGDLASAVASMGSDIQQHPETKMSDRALSVLVMVAMLHVEAGDPNEVRHWINGFH
jgi:hypothetical protein